MAPLATRCGSQRGFSLVETLVASVILATTLVSLAELIGMAVKSNASARTSTVATVLAAQKLEQLRALTFGFNARGGPITDTTTETGVSPPQPTGGTGLTPSTVNTLVTSVDGYVDYLDGDGRVVGRGTAIPPGTVYIRRWMITPVPANPETTLIVQVFVTQRKDRAVVNSQRLTQMPGEARLVTVRTRKAQ